ncbi:hypothetical protein [Streptomyces sp. NBC_00078]|uniref:hypothetical protein n=1 Tax=Streptomyces sp. NBC_00078 TaxID=2975643 RepID=UPI00225B4D5D|nr:hypothetical protein [Streptomyces sp. NBC_00078]MCX5426093.1 hypothetical protein [Streptomyces sp. NBC_00078]
MTNTQGQTAKDRRTAAQLLAAGTACALLTVGTGQTWAALLAAGLLVGALMTYRRTVAGQPYAYWIAWGTGTVLALLLAQVQPPARLLLLPLAGVEAVGAVVLFALWRTHQGGRRDWLVWNPEEGGLLRRESFKRDAIRWARNHHRPCLIDRVDRVPGLVGETPLYPLRERPEQQVPRPEA